MWLHQRLSLRLRTMLMRVAMKAVITGPRSGLTEKLTLPHMHIEVDLEELPKKGQVIILNGGGSYYVKDIMWWITGPENDAYWSRDQDYDVEGEFQTVHVTVEPDNRPERYGYPAGVTAGTKAGRQAVLTELRAFVAVVAAAEGDYNRLGMIQAWLEREIVADG